MNYPCTETMVRGVRVFDARWPDDKPWPKAPWGETLFGCERVAAQLGIREGYCGNDVHPVSISGCGDTRAYPDEYDRMVTRAVELFKEFAKEYADALANPATDGTGGSVYYLPVCVSICNFGASVIADRRVMAIRATR